MKTLLITILSLTLSGVAIGQQDRWVKLAESEYGSYSYDSQTIIFDDRFIEVWTKEVFYFDTQYEEVLEKIKIYCKKRAILIIQDYYYYTSGKNGSSEMFPRGVMPREIVPGTKGELIYLELCKYTDPK